jgi:diguanylate cyclase (GGDEF)-like protein
VGEEGVQIVGSDPTVEAGIRQGQQVRREAMTAQMGHLPGPGTNPLLQSRVNGQSKSGAAEIPLTVGADQILGLCQPLSHRGKLVGSINLCSNDALRFTRDHASDFLAHLGVIASFCIENTINRARLLRSGFTDVLTGWNNRRYLVVRLGEELARARRDQTRLVCLMLDVDHFKHVNDTYGHAAGDVVLRELAQRIESQVRASDVAARYGGEEFVVLLPDTDVAAAQRLAERIRAAIGGAPIGLPGGASITITASIGIAEVAPAQADRDLKTLGDSLLARADVALYAAKSAGRDRVIVEAA